MDITTELERNRATLNSARRKVGEVGGLTDQARRVLRAMSRREVKVRQLSSPFFCLFLVVGICDLTRRLVVFHTQTDKDYAVLLHHAHACPHHRRGVLFENQEEVVLFLLHSNRLNR